MQMQIDPYAFYPEPKYGEEISVPIPGFGVSHPGYYVGGGFVIDNSERRCGVRRVPIEEFRDGRKLSYHGFSGSLSPEDVVKNAYAALGKDYDFFFYNCKDFVRAMRGQAMRSLMIKGVITAGLIGSAAAFARRA